MRFLRSSGVKPLIERLVIPAGDILLAPFVFLAACLMTLVRRVGVYRMTVSRAILRRVGVFPIRDHYYEPMFHPRHLYRPLDQERRLPGIDFLVLSSRRTADWDCIFCCDLHFWTYSIRLSCLRFHLDSGLVDFHRLPSSVVA